MEKNEPSSPGSTDELEPGLGPDRPDYESQPLGRAEYVAADLLHPKFKISMKQAVRARLLRNYVYVFGFLLVGWLGRTLVLPPAQGRGLDGMFGIGGIPGWVPVALVAALYLGLLAVIVLTPEVEPPELCYWPDPRHRGVDVPSLDV